MSTGFSGCRVVWLFIFFCLLAVDAEAFDQPWQIIENEPEDWQYAGAELDLYSLKDWKIYENREVPFGINKTIWLKNILPPISDEHQVLYFANGLEDLQVYIGGELVYSFGDFNRKWTRVSPQRWHSIPLNPSYSGEAVMIRTHYALSYVVRTLYPEVRNMGEVLHGHITDSIPTVFLSGIFGILGLASLGVSLIRKHLDQFTYFGIMSSSICSWVLFNQDSIIKPYLPVSENLWSVFDLGGLYLAAASLISFLSVVASSRRSLIRIVSLFNWGLAAFVALISGLGIIHAWYTLPLLHLSVFPSLSALASLILLSAFKQNSDARLIVAGSAIISVSAIHDILRYSSYIHSPIKTMIPMGGLFLIVIMLAILSRRYREEREDSFRRQSELLTDIQGLHSELKIHVEKVEHLVSEKTREIRSIMTHIQQGIFMLVGRDLLIHEEHSDYLEELFEANELTGKSFQKVFLEKSSLTEDEQSMVLVILKTCIGEDILNFEANEANLPKEVHVNQGKNKKIVELTWAAIVDDDDQVDKVLVTARDITSLLKLKTLAEQSQEEVRLLQVILGSQPQSFLRFLNSTIRLLEDTLNAISIDRGAGSLDNAFRNLHTVKGNARSFQLMELSNMVHNCENLILELMKGHEPTILLNLESQLLEALKHSSRYQDLFRKYVPLEQDSNLVKVKREDLERVLGFDRDSRLRELDSLLLPLVYTPADAFFTEVFSQSSSLAKDLGKLSPRLRKSGENILLTSIAVHILSDCLGHLLRNSVDHGIEFPKERAKLGKPERGEISITYKVQCGSLMISYSDDGRGIQKDVILARARERGLLSKHDKGSDETVVDLIFSAGFTTKEEASLVSGRGVGLNAIRSLIEDHGGRFHLTLDSNEAAHASFSFEIILPETFFFAHSQQLNSQVETAS